MTRAWLVLALVAACGKDAANNPGFEGTYEDWDSYEDEPFFVKGPTFARDGHTVRIEADGYLPTIVTVPDDARAPFAARGMLRSRIEKFYGQLRAVWDPTTALVEIEIRRYPNDREPFDGVTIEVNGVQGHRRNGDMIDSWSPTNVTGQGSRYIVFPNVVVSGGYAMLSFSAAGSECRGPKTIKVEAGAVAFAQVSCRRR